MHELHEQAVIHSIRLHERQVIENTQRQLTMAFTRLASRQHAPGPVSGKKLSTRAR